MADFFKVDSRKISLREYWNILPSWKALIPWLAGWFNVAMPLGSGFRQPEKEREWEVAESEFPAEAKAKLQASLEDCLRSGFLSPRFFTYQNIRGDTRGSFIGLLHRSGEFTARLMHTLCTKTNPPTETQALVIMSELSDGTLFISSNQKPNFRSRPGIVTNGLIGARPAELVESHQQKLAVRHLRNPPRIVNTPEALDDAWDRHEASSLEYNVKRGLFVRMSAEEVASEQAVQQSAQGLAAEGVEHADVLVEIGQLQNKKGGWRNAILIFVVSMILFVGAGSQQWSWKFAVMLVPILFLHELGHYVAMRAFDYRNLRMFFLPFFGAAVSGRHYNVPGWKKVIVFMMGPVPGIILGVIIGGIGLVLQKALLIQVALVMLILNGINLLPVLPLDGGWVFHALVFSRHPLLDAAFRVLAVGALALGGIFSHDKILLYLSIPMLLGIPAAYRTARITSDLRKRGVPPGSPDDQTIPTETAQLIIGEVKKTLPKGQTNKMIAQKVLQIFETLNAKPPGWLATSGLLFGYVMSLGMALVFGLLLIFGQDGDLRGSLAPNLNRPKRSLICGTTSSWRGSQADGSSGAARVTIVGNFPRHEATTKAFENLAGQLPPSATLTAFGDSLFLALPADASEDRKRWFAELQRQTKDVFVETTNHLVRVSLSCRVPNETLANELGAELTEYFSSESVQTLIPPWQPNDSRTTQDRAAHQLARKTFLRTQMARWVDYSEPRMSALQKKISEAERQGDEAEVNALIQQVTEITEQSRKQGLSKLKTGTEGTIDPVIIDLVMTMPDNATGTNRNAQKMVLQQIAHRMGQLPLVNGRVDPLEEGFSTRGGSVYRKGPNLNFNWLLFKRTSEGAPALVTWLCAKGCTDFKYDIQSGMSAGEEDE